MRSTSIAVCSLLLAVSSTTTTRAQSLESIKPYVSGTVTGSFIEADSGGFNTVGLFNNTGSDDSDVYGLGGALGIAADFDAWRARLEVEGMWRDDQVSVTNSFMPPTPTFFYQVQADSNWSVLGNMWLDVPVAEFFSIYGGGGLGGAGGQLTVNDTVVGGTGHDEGFAWQAGAGMIVELTDTVELDLGYRFVDMGETAINLQSIGIGTPAGNYTLERESHEILATLRVLLP